MSLKKTYNLKPKIGIKPLFKKWCAWLYLISHTISAINVSNRHLKNNNNSYSLEEVYVMILELWLEFISSIKYTKESIPIVASDRLLETCKQRGLITERLFDKKELLY